MAELDVVVLSNLLRSNQGKDSVSMFSSSGTADVPVYATKPLQIQGSVDMVPLRMKQGTAVSTLNSSTANIAAGAYFNGGVEDAIDINGIQTIVKADQPLTMYVDQSIDAFNWDIIDSFPVASGVGDARTHQSVAPYFRVRAYNAGSFATTYFRLATGMTPFIEAFPRKLVQHGGDSAGISVSAQQDVIASTLNSSTSNLDGSATFTGSSETTLGVVGIQVNLKTTQNCTVYVDQSPDGTNWDITDSYAYYYSLGGNSWTVQATASFFRVRVTNLSTSATSYFRLQIALCPMVEALPRSLDEHGDLKTCLQSINGKFGHDAIVSPMGALKTATSVRLAGAGFTGDIVDGNFWQSTTTGNATITQTVGILTLSTGNPTANGNALLKSTRIARYVGANPNYYRANGRCPTVTTTVGTNVRRWGAFDENDGFFFEANQANGASTPILRVVCRKGGTDTNYVASGSFNGDQGSIYTLDTNVHTYEIFWTNKNAYFCIDDILIHTFTGTTTTLVSSPSLKIGLQSLNAGGNTAANTLAVRSSTINRLGNFLTQPMYYNVAANTTAAGVTLKYGAGNLHSVAVNKPGDSANILSLYDGTATTGSAIGALTCTIDKEIMPKSIDYKGLPFASGLHMSLQTGTAGNYTIIYE